MTDLIEKLRTIAEWGHNDFREIADYSPVLATVSDAASEIEALCRRNRELLAMLREAWMITSDPQSPGYLREFHNRLDAQAMELGLRLPR